MTRKKVRFSKIETSNDILSNLPDCVILNILSLLNAKQAVQSCILSSRWKNLWKHLPVLVLHSTHFQTYHIFINFVSTLLSLRHSSTSLQTLDFKSNDGYLEPHILKNILNYAFTHNIKCLRLCFDCGIQIHQIPPTIFSSHTLTHLTLSIHCYGLPATLPKSFNLPALTSLQLGNYEFCVGDNDCAEPFSTLNRLNTLLISNCSVIGTGTLCISNATLVNLTIYNHPYTHYNKFHTIELYTPSLCTFAFTGTPSQKLYGRNVSSLKHVDIYAEIIPCSKEPPLFLFSWLLEFSNIKSLTVSTTTLQVLDSLKINLSSLSFGNLNSLKVKMEPISYLDHMSLTHLKLAKAKSRKEAVELVRAFEEGLLKPFSPIPDGIVDILLRNSPSAKVDYIDCSSQPLRETHL